MLLLSTYQWWIYMLKLCIYVYLCFCSKLVKYNVVIDEFTSDCCCYEMLLLMIETLGNINHRAWSELVLFLRTFYEKWVKWWFMLKLGVAKKPVPASVMGTGRVAKRVPADIINGYLATRYFMDTDTDMMIPVPAGIRTR